MKDYKPLIMIVIILCLLPPVLILICYGIYVNDLPFDFSMKSISNNSNNWSAFGSLLSGAFTLSGAAATISTLLFAFYQNKKLSLEAEKRNKQD